MDLSVTFNLWQLLMLVLVLLVAGVMLGVKLRAWAEGIATAIVLMRASPPQLRGWNPGPWKVRRF